MTDAIASAANRLASRKFIASILAMAILTAMQRFGFYSEAYGADVLWVLGLYITGNVTAKATEGLSGTASIEKKA